MATAISGIRGAKDSDVGPLRTYLEPVVVKPGGRFAWNESSGSFVWANRPVDGNLAAVFLRRQLEASRGGLVGVPIKKSPRPAPLADVLAFLYDETDDDKLNELIWGLSAVAWPSGQLNPRPGAGLTVPFEFGVLRLLVEPLKITANRRRWRLGGDEATTPDPEVFHALMSGQVDAVGKCIDLAARRLKSDGRLVVGYCNRQRAGKSLAVLSQVRPPRLLAACLIPLCDSDLELIANVVLNRPQTQE